MNSPSTVEESCWAPPTRRSLLRFYVERDRATFPVRAGLRYSDALTTADRVVTLRYLLSVLAYELVLIATFMPKQFADRTELGLHLHLSLRSSAKASSCSSVAMRTRSASVCRRLRTRLSSGFSGTRRRFKRSSPRRLTPTSGPVELPPAPAGQPRPRRALPRAATTGPIS